MLVLAVLGTVTFALANAFGAWVTQYRRRWLAWLFLVAAFLLVLALVALIYGAVLTWLGSFLHAHLVARKVVFLNHLLRASAVAAIFTLALLGLQ